MVGLNRSRKCKVVYFPNTRLKETEIVSTADNKMFTVGQQAVQTSTNKRHIFTS